MRTKVFCEIVQPKESPCEQTVESAKAKSDKKMYSLQLNMVRARETAVNDLCHCGKSIAQH